MKGYSIQFASVTLLTTLALGQGPVVAQEPPVQSITVEAELSDTSGLDAYTLDTGDRVNIAIFGAENYSGETLVLPDGSLNLPTAGAVNVRGLTLRQAADVIAVQYRPFIHRPIVTVTLIELRPIRVGIAGEINRPGTYNLSGAEGESATPFSTLTEAIKAAGGITPRADLRQVQVKRLQHDDSRQTITINLWELLMTGDLSKDILLHAGDSVFVPTATALTPAEAIQLGTASFAQDSIPVYVVGEVMSPGAINVPPNTPLNQALLAAGGLNPRRATDSVQLVRLNPNGTVSQSEVTVDLSQGVDSASNPILQKGDVIVVGRSGFARFSDSVDDALGPFGRILSGILGLFTLF